MEAGTRQGTMFGRNVFLSVGWCKSLGVSSMQEGVPGSCATTSTLSALGKLINC